jgi:molybdopterin/thiamine biosynthesis adenylyltransferase
MLADGQHRFSRQVWLAGWQQAKLSDCRVMIIGAGALGNEVAKNLALTGIGNLLIIDFDKVELSNLSRTVLFSEEDIGSYKAKTLAQACKRLYPSMNASFIIGDIMDDIGLGFYREADLIIGCLDNIAARSHASTNAILAGTPYLDTGVWGYGGELKWFFPENSACFDCSLSEKDKNDISLRYSCTGFKSANNENTNIMIPTTLAPAAIIGGVAAQEICHYFSETRTITPGDVIVYNGIEPALYKSFLPPNPSCEHHANGSYKNVINLAYRADNVSAKEILGIAAEVLGKNVTLELRKDFLVNLHCRNCNESEIINDLISKVSEEKSFCPKCKKRRDKTIITSMTMKDDISNELLSTLGISRGDVLVLHSVMGMEFYQLNGDIQALLPLTSNEYINA